MGYEKAREIMEKARKGIPLTFEELNTEADPHQKVGHILAKKSLSGNFPIEKAAKDEETFVKALSISNEDGWTVAHELARNGYSFKRTPEVDELLLTLKTKAEHFTPLHILALYYPILFVNLFSPDEKEFYKVSDKEGITPAHIIVENGVYPFSEKDKELLLLPAGLNAPTVLEIAIVKGFVTSIEDKELFECPLTIGMSAGEFLKIYNSLIKTA